MPYIEASVRREQLVAAARSALTREGVARTSLRVVAAEAGVPLGTLQYVFPSKEQLLRAVIEDLVDEVAAVLKAAAELEGGPSTRSARAWPPSGPSLVAEQANLQVIQYELVTYALPDARDGEPGPVAVPTVTPSIVAEWCQEAANKAGETCGVPFARLARVLVAGVDGLVLQHVCRPHPSRSREDLPMQSSRCSSAWPTCGRRQTPGAKPRTERRGRLFQSLVWLSAPRRLAPRSSYGLPLDMSVIRLTYTLGVSQMHDVDVVVVGAGLAGLSRRPLAGSRGPHRPVVLEARDRVAREQPGRVAEQRCSGGDGRSVGRPDPGPRSST